jgi:RHS repeat-associated protein
MENKYDAFGKPYRGDLAGGMSLGYMGKPYDPVTGLYDYGYRDYKPELARFTTVDPIRDGSNWFVYVNNDPVNWIDPWGLSASDGGRTQGNAGSNNGPLGFEETYATYIDGTNKAREAIIGNYANGILNSGVNNFIDVSTGQVGESKAFSVQAGTDARVNQGELNLNVEVVGARTAGSVGVMTENNKWGIGLQGSIDAYSAGAFVGLRESSIGAEAGAAILTFEGALVLTTLGFRIEIGGEFFIGGAKVGVSAGLNNSIKLGKGVGHCCPV